MKRLLTVFLSLPMLEHMVAADKHGGCHLACLAYIGGPRESRRLVGKAAYVALRNHTTPRGVHTQYPDFLKDLMRQPGAARRSGMDNPLTVPESAKPPAAEEAK